MKSVLKKLLPMLMLTSQLVPVHAVENSVSPPANVPDKPSIILKAEPTNQSLAGRLRNADLWASYKSRFISDKGRVIDTANAQISHSEGQGYGMLLAVAAADRNAFDRIWGWTRANLMVRDDQLIAWRWEPNNRPAVADMNNASDGDLLIAWALTEAAEFWNDAALRLSAQRLASEVGRKLILTSSKYGPLILPAIAGFSNDERPDGPVVNLSYWVFPAFDRLALVSPEIDWAGLKMSGVALVKEARFGSAKLPTEWISVHGDEVKPAEQFPQQFSYNSIRIPLYLAWAGLNARELYEGFAGLWANSKSAQVASVDVVTGRSLQPMAEPGYSTVAALTLCVVNGTPMPRDLNISRPGENYYPATLHLMSLLAVEMRYQSCLRA
jgi:endo-1,4-beta-D-glucanase Y